MKILITSDHAGFDMKNQLFQFLKLNGFEVIDCGPHELNSDDDYTDFVAPVAHQISENTIDTRGIIIGGSGQGEAMMANRFSGVRAAVYYGVPVSTDGRIIPDVITLSRQHNNANILSLGARFLLLEEAKSVVMAWLTTDFSGEERHERRNKKIDELSPGIHGESL